jgi:serine phosphatase RsbU (regulator of sigma subunit)
MRDLHMKVLVVDDDDPETISQSLRRSGFAVKAVKSPEEALSEINNEYDGILLDMWLDSDKSGGLKVLQKVFGQRRETYPAVVVLTAHASRQNTLSAMELGAMGYVDKDDMAQVPDILRRTIKHVRSVSRKYALWGEINAARNIQVSGFPKAIDVKDGVSIFGINIPALAVSGDSYQFARLPERDSLAFMLCDVCGHGLAPAIASAQLGRTFRIAIVQGWSLSRIDQELQETMCTLGDDEVYSTGIVGVLHADSHYVEMIVAGHELPLLAANGKVVSAGDPELAGMCWGNSREAVHYARVDGFRFERGASLLLYTDGVLDTSRDSDENLTRDHLCTILTEARPDNAGELCGRILYEALRKVRFVRAFPDDITVMGLTWR